MGKRNETAQATIRVACVLGFSDHVHRDFEKGYSCEQIAEKHQVSENVVMCAKYIYDKLLK